MATSLGDLLAGVTVRAFGCGRPVAGGQKKALRNGRAFLIYRSII